MINQISCNSNNAIELSRGELLSWLNSLLKLNYSKIQQLGTGAAYCQLLDFIYPGKVPLGKVNWKAKFDYQYLNNFKVLQQSFTKLNIMKHIDVQKLVKCKYQDNLEFLQWFKKIFDTTGSSAKDYDALTRRGDKLEKQKQNKTPVPYLTDPGHQTSYLSSSSNSKPSTQRTMQPTQSTKDSFIQKFPDQPPTSQSQSQQQQQRTIQKQVQVSPTKLRTYNPNNERIDERLVQMFMETRREDNLFHLSKIKQIQDILENWDCRRGSTELICAIRDVILVKPQVGWRDEEEQEQEGRDD